MPGRGKGRARGRGRGRGKNTVTTTVSIHWNPPKEKEKDNPASIQSRQVMTGQPQTTNRIQGQSSSPEKGRTEPKRLSSEGRDQGSPNRTDSNQQATKQRHLSVEGHMKEGERLLAMQELGLTPTSINRSGEAKGTGLACRTLQSVEETTSTNQLASEQAKTSQPVELTQLPLASTHATTSSVYMSEEELIEEKKKNKKKREEKKTQRESDSSSSTKRSGEAKGTGLARRTDQSVEVTTSTNQLASAQAKSSQPVELTQFPLASTHATTSSVYMSEEKLEDKNEKKKKRKREEKKTQNKPSVKPKTGLQVNLHTQVSIQSRQVMEGQTAQTTNRNQGQSSSPEKGGTEPKRQSSEGGDQGSLNRTDSNQQATKQRHLSVEEHMKKREQLLVMQERESDSSSSIKRSRKAKGTGLARRTDQSVEVTTSTNQLASAQAKSSQPVELTQFPLASTHATTSSVYMSEEELEDKKEKKKKRNKREEKKTQNKPVKPKTGLQVNLHTPVSIHSRQVMEGQPQTTNRNQGQSSSPEKTKEPKRLSSEGRDQGSPNRTDSNQQATKQSHLSVKEFREQILVMLEYESDSSSSIKRSRKAKGTGLARRTDQSVEETTSTNQLASAQAKSSQPVELTQFPLASTHATTSSVYMSEEGLEDKKEKKKKRKREEKKTQISKKSRKELRTSETVKNWNCIQTLEELKESKIRAVPSRLQSLRSYKNKLFHVVDGQEIIERVSPPESMSVHQVADLLCLGKDNSRCQNNRQELKRLISLIPEKKAESKNITSAWTLLTKGDAQYQLTSLGNIFEEVVDREAIQASISKSIIGSSTQKKAQIEQTKVIMQSLIDGLDATPINTLTHGRLLGGVWDLLKSLFPEW